MLLRDLHPERVYRSPELARLYDAADALFTQIWADVADVEAQLRVGTATWGLKLWERDYGLTPDVSETFDERRARVRSHMRGAGTTTVEMLRNLTAAYLGGETAVDDTSELWHLIVTFIGVVGVPSNMGDLKAAVAAARPAHMIVDYIIRYNLWGEVKTHTWGALAARTWHDVKGAAL